MRRAVAHLPLHTGRAPRWLFARMTRLASVLAEAIVAEFGTAGFLDRISDPFWFQCLGCVLGFDWHSSGLTTTTCGAIKEGLRGRERALGLFVAGGKGRAARRTPEDIRSFCEQTGLAPDRLTYASRLSAKVDSSAVQDGFQVYHHAFFFDAHGQWAVVQQGMNEASGWARRYHWRSDPALNFVCEPHRAVCSDHRTDTLNLVATESEATRRAMAEVSQLHIDQLLREIQTAARRTETLTLPKRHVILPEDLCPKRLRPVLLRVYERQPEDFERLLGIEGVGARTLRALTLASELLYGATPSFRDPARFSFAHGGKDGVPYPVDRQTYDRTIAVMERAVAQARLGRSETFQALKRLARFQRPESNGCTPADSR